MLAGYEEATRVPRHQSEAAGCDVSVDGEHIAK